MKREEGEGVKIVSDYIRFILGYANPSFKILRYFTIKNLNRLLYIYAEM